MRRASETHCAQGHELTENNRFLTRQFYLYCRLCASQANQRATQKQRERIILLQTPKGREILSKRTVEIKRKRMERLAMDLGRAEAAYYHALDDLTFGRPGSQRRIVFDYLCEHEATTRQIADVLDLNYLTTINRITELEDRGLIVSLRKVKTSMNGLHANVWKALPCVNTAELPVAA